LLGPLGTAKHSSTVGGSKMQHSFNYNAHCKTKYTVSHKNVTAYISL